MKKKQTKMKLNLNKTNFVLLTKEKIDIKILYAL